MRTAIISTEFWESDEIASLNSDTRSIYMCLLTNPKRNTTNVFKLSNRLISFYSGFNTDVVKTCLKQLSDDNYIIMVDGYFILTGQEYVKAKRGRLTSDIEDSFLASLPEKVKETLINNNISSREALEHSLVYKHNNKDKDNNKDNNINKDNKELDIIKERFDLIRTKHKRILKGKARGLETEWSNFIKKNPKPTLYLIETMTLGAKNYYKSESKKLEADNPFRYTQNFSTWINQKSWEMYLPDNNK